MSEKLRKLKDRASQAFGEGRLKDALKLFAEVIEQDPTEIASRIKIGDIHRRLGQKQPAIEAYEPVARHYAEDGLLLKAIAVCKLILSVDATHTHTQEMLANLYSKRGDPSAPSPRATIPPAARPRTTIPPPAAAAAPAPAPEIEVDINTGDMVIERNYADETAAASTESTGAPPLTSNAPPPPMWPPPPSSSAEPPKVVVGNKVDSPPVIMGSKLQSAPPVIMGNQVPPKDQSAPHAIMGSQVPPKDQSAPHVIMGSRVDAPPVRTATPARTTTPPPAATPPAGFVAAWPVPTAQTSAPGWPPQATQRSTTPDIVIEAEEEAEPGEVIELGAPSGPASPAVVDAEEQQELEDLLDAAQAASKPHPTATLAELEEAAEAMADEDLSESRPIELSRTVRKDREELGGLGLPEIPLFSDLPKNAFIEILVQMEMRELNSGDFVIREGEVGDSFFILASGKVRVVRRGEGGEEIVLAYLTDGAFFGEMALLQDGARTASVIVEEESQVFEISRAVLDQVVAQHPSVARVLRNFYTQRLLSTTMATHPLFRPFNNDERRGLMEKFRSKMFKTGDVLVNEGAKGEGLYLLLTGALEVSRLRDGAPVVIALLSTGDVFGEMSLLMNRPTIATVTAVTDSFILRLAKKDFDELIMTHPQVLELIAKISEEREIENSAIFADWNAGGAQGAALV